VQRRNTFAKTEIYLPMVLRVADGQTRPMDYEEDILFALDWQGLDVSSLVAKIPGNVASAENQMRRIRLADSGEERIIAEVVGVSQETLAFDAPYAVRMISDVVPNAWWSREIVGQVIAGLEARGFDKAKLGQLSGLIVEELRKWLDEQRSAKGEALFRAEVAAGRIQFRLRTDDRNWRMPFEAETYEPAGADQLIGKDGGPLGKSLFSPIYKGDFSSQDERDIAVYLDGDSALKWWHRNVARSHYSVQGWRREKIYPDFIFAVRHGERDNKLVVLEMKGKHLAGNDDTEYKKAVLRLMTDAFSVEHVSRVGELELVVEDGTTIQCDLVLMPEWPTRLPTFMI
jgi:type III restriction enzyme